MCCAVEVLRDSPLALQQRLHQPTLSVCLECAVAHLLTGRPLQPLPWIRRARRNQGRRLRRWAPYLRRRTRLRQPLHWPGLCRLRTRLRAAAPAMALLQLNRWHLLRPLRPVGPMRSGAQRSHRDHIYIAAKSSAGSFFLVVGCNRRFACVPGRPQGCRRIRRVAGSPRMCGGSIDGWCIQGYKTGTGTGAGTTSDKCSIESPTR